MAGILANAAQENAAGSNAEQKETAQNVPADTEPERKLPEEERLEKELAAAARQIKLLTNEIDELTNKNKDLKRQITQLQKDYRETVSKKNAKISELEDRLSLRGLFKNTFS